MNKAVPLPSPVGTAVVEPVGWKPIFLSSPAVMSYYSFPLEPLGKNLTTAITPDPLSSQWCLSPLEPIGKALTSTPALQYQEGNSIPPLWRL